MSILVTSRKRARRSTSMISATISSEDAPPSQAIRNMLPTELIYTILAIAIGDYLADMVLTPSKILTWDAIMTFLHVSHAFKECTIKLLYHLWGTTFIDANTKKITNYKPTLSTFRLRTRQARNSPRADPWFEERDIRHPISPLAVIWSTFICIKHATEYLIWDQGTPDSECDVFEVYTEKRLQVINDSYNEIPAGVRHLLLGDIMHNIMRDAALWTRLEGLKRVVYSARRALFKGVVDLIPKEASPVPTTDDVPPLLGKHVAAVGLAPTLSLLRSVERNGGNAGLDAGHCQELRARIACSFTETEKLQFLK